MPKPADLIIRRFLHPQGCQEQNPCRCQGTTIHSWSLHNFLKNTILFFYHCDPDMPALAEGQQLFQIPGPLKHPNFSLRQNWASPTLAWHFSGTVLASMARLTEAGFYTVGQGLCSQWTNSLPKGRGSSSGLRRRSSGMSVSCRCGCFPSGWLCLLPARI